MAWTKDFYPIELKYLRKSIREKAIDIANLLIESGLSKNQALKVAIAQARSLNRLESGNIGHSTNLRSRKGINPLSVNYFIVKNDEEWTLKGENDSFPRVSFKSIDEALARGRKIVKLTKGSLYMYKENGALRQIVY